jgi:hypothetical protein
VHEAEIVAAFDRAAGMLQRASELLQKGAVPAA